MLNKNIPPWGQAPHNYGYVLIERKRKGKPYVEINRFACSGQCCQSNAEDHCEKALGLPEDHLWHSRDLRLVDSETWRRMQVKAHLKQIGY